MIKLFSIPQTSDASGEVRFIYAIWLILAAAAFLKLLFVSQTIGSDDLDYFMYAERLLRFESLEQPDPAASRLALLILIGLPAGILGKVIYSSLASIAFSIAMEILITSFVLRNFGGKAACVTALFVCFSGISLTYSGILLPDATLAFFFSLAIIKLYLILSGEDSRSPTRFLIVGLLIGVAYSIKDTGLLLLPPIALCLVFQSYGMAVRSRLTAFTIIVSGVFVVWLAESTTLYLLSGDFFYRAHSISGVLDGGLGGGGERTIPEFLRHGYNNLGLIWRESGFLLIPSILAVWSSLFVILRRRADSLFGLVTIVCVGYMLFGSYSLTRLVNLPFQERYLFPLLPLVGISLAIMFKELSTRYRSLIAGSLLISACFALIGSAERAGDRYYEGYLGNVTAGIETVHQTGAVVYTDQRTIRALQHLLPEDEWRKVRSIPKTGELPKGYYVMHPQSDAGQERVGQIRSIPVTLRYYQDRRLIVSLFPQFERKARLGADFRLLKVEDVPLFDQ